MCAKICLRIRAVCPESSLDAFWIANDLKFLHVHNEDSNQTARMRRLIIVSLGAHGEGKISPDVAQMVLLPFKFFCMRSSTESVLTSPAIFRAIHSYVPISTSCAFSIINVPSSKMV